MQGYLKLLNDEETPIHSSWISGPADLAACAEKSRPSVLITYAERHHKLVQHFQTIRKQMQPGDTYHEFSDRAQLQGYCIMRTTPKGTVAATTKQCLVYCAPHSPVTLPDNPQRIAHFLNFYTGKVELYPEWISDAMDLEECLKQSKLALKQQQNAELDALSSYYAFFRQAMQHADTFHSFMSSGDSLDKDKIMLGHCALRSTSKGRRILHFTMANIEESLESEK